MLSSLLLLSLSTVFAVLGLAGVGIAAFSTNWIEYHVNRREIINAFNREPELNIKLKDAFIRDPLYFSRNYGLFHVCFSDAVPSDIGSFTYLASPCVFNDDYLPGDAKQASMSSQEVTRLYVMRAAAVLYAAGIIVGLLSLATGIAGCWRTSTRIIVATAILMIISVLMLGAAMAAWHYVQYLERWTLERAPFFKSWEPVRPF